MPRNPIAGRIEAAQPLTVVVIDDSLAERQLYARWLESAGHTVYAYADGAIAIEALESRRADIVYLDVDMPGMGGLATLDRLSQICPGTPVVILTGRDDSETAVSAMRLGAADYVTKPAGRDELLRVLRELTDGSDPAKTAAASPESGQVSVAQRHERLLSRFAEGEQRYELLVDTARVAIFGVSADGVITEVNPEAERLLGVEKGDLLGKELDQPPLPSLQSNLLAALRSGAGGDPVTRLEVARCGHDGTDYTSMWDIVPLQNEHGQLRGAIACGQDFTELRTMESRYLQAQRKDAIGQFAGGITHDFNNLIAAIRLSTELIMDEVEEGTEAWDSASIVMATADRAAALTRKILAFSRRESDEVRELDLHETLEAMSVVLRPLVGSRIAIRTALHSESGTVLADAIQVEQVIMNLILNARDAMDGQGELSISTRDIEVARDESGLAPGGYILFTVADNGSGMPEHVRDQIFEPYFTTKDPGRGTGLGLATVHGIVTKLGGDIRVESSLGEGTSFHVYLPRVAAPVETKEPEAVSADVATLKSATILLVEDEASVMRATRRALERQGHRVIPAMSGDEALRLGPGGVESNGTKIDLVLSDRHLGDALGTDVIAALRGRSPELPAILMSGDHSLPDEVHIDLLPKPFTIEELYAVVSGALQVARERAA